MNFTAITALVSRFFKLNTSDEALEIPDATLYVVDGAYGLALVQRGDCIVAKLTVYDNNLQKTLVLSKVMDQSKPIWLNVSPDWRNDPNYSAFYNEFSFGDWLENIYKSVHEHNKKTDPAPTGKPATSMRSLKMINPENVAAAAFSSGDEDFEERLTKLLSFTKSMATEETASLRGASLDLCIREIRKLPKLQIGLYALACASMEKEVSGMTEAATLVFNTALDTGKK